VTDVVAVVSWQWTACRRRASVTACPDLVQCGRAGSRWRTCDRWLCRCSTATHSLSRWPTDDCLVAGQLASRRRRRATPSRRRQPSDLYQFYVDDEHSTSPTSSTTPCRPTTACRTRLSAPLVPRTGTYDLLQRVSLICLR